jgi:hypothetical protein
VEQPPVPTYTFTELAPLAIAHSQLVPSSVEMLAMLTDDTGVVELTLTLMGPALAPGPEIVKAAGLGEKNRFCACAAPGRPAKTKVAKVKVLVKRSIFTSATNSFLQSYTSLLTAH